MKRVKMFLQKVGLTTATVIGCLILLTSVAGLMFAGGAYAFEKRQKPVPQAKPSISETIEIPDFLINIAVDQAKELGARYNVPVDGTALKQTIKETKLTPADLIYIANNKDRFIKMVKERR